MYHFSCVYYRDLKFSFKMCRQEKSLVEQVTSQLIGNLSNRCLKYVYIKLFIYRVRRDRLICNIVQKLIHLTNQLTWSSSLRHFSISCEILMKMFLAYHSFRWLMMTFSQYLIPMNHKLNNIFYRKPYVFDLTTFFPLTVRFFKSRLPNQRIVHLISVFPEFFLFR